MENSSRFFKNSECSFFPCHQNFEGGTENFNCFFCFCPLYGKTPCPGNPTYIKKDDGRIIKRCTDCTFPHKPENYDKIMSLLKTSAQKNDVFSEYHHGGEVNQKLRPEILDMSVNTNPLGLPESVKKTLQSSLELLERYPDQNCTLLKEKLADAKAIPPENLIFGNGASELISLFVQAVSPKSALIVSPTFSGYERALKICYSKIHHHLLSEESDFTLDDTIFNSIDKTSPDMLFLCSPNNPTGKMVDFDLLKKLVSVCEEKGIFLFVDECFIEFTGLEKDSCVSLIEENQHLIVLNAFTKIYAMAGIRLGYACTSNQGLLAKVNFLRPEWNVSSLAQIAGLSALEEGEYLQKTRALIKQEREYLSKELKALGFKVYPGEANFILFDSKGSLCQENPASPRQSIGEFLLNKGILLRNCANFTGLSENFWRVAVRNHDENEKLISLLKDSVIFP